MYICIYNGGSSKPIFLSPKTMKSRRKQWGFVHALPFQVRDLSVLYGLGFRDVVFRVDSGSRDEEHSDRGDDGAGVEAALALEEVYGDDGERIIG